MKNAPRKKYITVEQLRQEHLRTKAYIGSIKQENDHIGKALAVMIREIGRIRRASEELKKIQTLRIIVQEVEKIGRASQGIALLLQEWQPKVTE